MKIAGSTYFGFTIRPRKLQNCKFMKVNQWINQALSVTTLVGWDIAGEKFIVVVESGERKKVRKLLKKKRHFSRVFLIE